MQYCVKCLGEIHVNYVSTVAFIKQTCNLVKESYQFCLTRPTFHDTILTALIRFLISRPVLLESQINFSLNK